MKNMHKKFGCGHTSWIRYGRRRRRCRDCGYVWRTYPHKRGARRKRKPLLFEKYLSGALPSLVHYAKKKKVSARYLSHILESQRDIFVKKTPWPKIPEGPVILIADAFLHQVQHMMYTAYLVLVRAVDEEKAVILPPYIAPGKERILNWYKTLNMIPLEVHKRVKALVCDGNRGTVTYARRSGWVLQRCTFHLLSAMQGRRSRRKYSCHRDEGKLIYELTKQALVEEDENKLFKLLSELEALGWQTKSNQLKRIISGFVRSKDDYRSWITHPELNLPDTSNSMESFIGIFEKFHSRSHGFRSPESLTQWIVAILKHRKEIFCRPKRREKQPN